VLKRNVVKVKTAEKLRYTLWVSNLFQSFLNRQKARRGILMH